MPTVGIGIKGDVLASDGVSFERVAVGANSRVLTAWSSAARGVAWGGPGGLLWAIPAGETVTVGDNMQYVLHQELSLGDGAELVLGTNAELVVF